MKVKLSGQTLLGRGLDQQRSDADGEWLIIYNAIWKGKTIRAGKGYYKICEMTYDEASLLAKDLLEAGEDYIREPVAEVKAWGRAFIKDADAIMADVRKKLTQDEAMQEADFIVKRVKDNFPEDDWYSVGSNWDLNVYLNMDGETAAALFPVVNGKTITETWKDVPIKKETK